MSGIEVICRDLSLNPKCPHGPTILFSRNVKNTERQFFACSACRNRKDCSFFLWADEKFNKNQEEFWKQEIKKIVEGVNHVKSFSIFHEVKLLPKSERCYCHTCSCFVFPKSSKAHFNHELESNIEDEKLLYPTKLLRPLESNKKEAQFLFTEKTVKTLIGILRKNNLRNVLCVGAPRICEYILNNCDEMTTLLLDIDKRFINFVGPLQFCWYNLFNHHFFLPESKRIFEDFLQTNKGKGLVLVMDPPFGGRVEPIVCTLKMINDTYKHLNMSQEDMAAMWIFPYFMEPHVTNSLPDFKMLDYKVDYDNHGLFRSVPGGRKYGSPIRIFTNIKPSLIELPADEGYKHCRECNRWVSSENNHCFKCNACTSKDGRTYVHCDLCKRCVKPTWKHCKACSRCAQPEHKCDQIEFVQTCFHCKEKGHKKRDCPKVDHEALQNKRKAGVKCGKRKKRPKND